MIEGFHLTATLTSPLWLTAGLYVLWLFADAATASWEIEASLKRINASPLRVRCPRCNAGPFIPCAGMRYEVHAARDVEFEEEKLREMEYR